jgi:hypothetical protein
MQCSRAPRISPKASIPKLTGDMLAVVLTSSRPTALLLVGLALGLGACGDDSDEKEKRTAQTYREDLGALCRADKRDVNALSKPKTRRDLLPYFRRALNVSKKREGAYRALRPPPKLRAPHNALLRADREGDALLTRLIGELDGGADPAKTVTRSLPRLGRLIDKSNLLARRLKAPDCVVDVNQFSQPSPSSS